MNQFIFAALLLLSPLNTMNMEYLKKYFVPETSVSTSIEEARLVPLKAKIGILTISNDLNFLQTLKILTQAAKNNDIQGIILLIDNYGGDTAQFSTLHDLIKKIITLKPIVGLVYGGACSGGYMVASASTYLICAEASNIGSIGVIVELPKYSNQHMVGTQNNNLDATLDVEIMSIGSYKTITNAHAPLTESQRIYLKEGLEKSYQYFINLVACNRNLSTENYLDWADAKIFFGFEALKLGLVDQIGTLLDAEEKVLELIKQKSPDILFDNTIETVDLN